MLPTIAKFTNSILKFGYVKKLSEILSVAEEAVLMELQKVSQPAMKQAPAPKLPAFAGATRSVEKGLLRLMLEDGDVVKRVKQEIDPEDFRDERIRHVVMHLFQLTQEGKAVNVSNLTSCLADEQTSRMLSQLMASEDILLEQSREKMCRDFIHRIKTDKVRLERQDISRQIRLAEAEGDHEKVNVLKERFNQLVKG